MFHYFYISVEELSNRIVVHKIESLEACTHEIALPPGHEYIPLLPHKGIKLFLKSHIIIFNVLFLNL